MRLPLIILISAITLGLLLAVPKPSRLPTQLAGTGCRMVTLDVGQGDAILFLTADHHTVLFDGGPGKSILDALDRHLPAGTKSIDLVVSTHPDADHLAGLVSVLEHYQVRSILTTGVQVTTKLFQTWTSVLASEQATLLHAQANKVFTVGDAFRFEEVWPIKNYDGVLVTEASSNGAGGTNDTGVTGRVVCSGSTVMMTGDISYAVEDKIDDHPEQVQSAALKAGHHGSKYSSTLSFLRAVEPKMVTLSVGAKNRYGHPSATVIDRLVRLGIPYLRTDQVGDIVLQSAGDGTWAKR